MILWQQSRCVIDAKGRPIARRPLVNETHVVDRFDRRCQLFQGQTSQLKPGLMIADVEWIAGACYAFSITWSGVGFVQRNVEGQRFVEHAGNLLLQKQSETGIATCIDASIDVGPHQTFMNR